MSDCREYQALLDAYVDGELAVGAQRRFEGHLEACPACGARHRQTVELLRGAADLPGEIAPSRDLWPAIASRIEADRVVPLRRRTVSWLAAAATLAAAAVFFLVILPRVRVAAPVAARSGTDSGVRPAMSAVEPTYAGYGELNRAAGELKRVLEESRAGLSPETRKVVDDNLEIIDQAIANVKRALGEDPDNQALTVLLTATYQRQIDLLKLATEASHRT